MNYTDIIPLIQADIYAVLRADPIIGLRAGVLMEKGDVASIFAESLVKCGKAGSDNKVGLGFIVYPIEECQWEDPNVAYGPLRLPIVIQFVENVTANRGTHGTGYTLRQLATYAAKVLSSYGPTGLATDLIPEKNVLTLFTAPDDENLRVAQLNFYCYEADPVVLEQVSCPQIVFDGVDACTITCADATSIWVTYDGSHPSSIASGADEIAGTTGGVGVSSGQLVRARGYAANKLASKTAAYLVP